MADSSSGRARVIAYRRSSGSSSSSTRRAPDRRVIRVSLFRPRGLVGTHDVYDTFVYKNKKQKGVVYDAYTWKKSRSRADNGNTFRRESYRAHDNAAAGRRRPDDGETMFVFINDAVMAAARLRLSRQRSVRRHECDCLRTTVFIVATCLRFDKSRIDPNTVRLSV